jgi:hypothetical protein
VTSAAAEPAHSGQPLVHNRSPGQPTVTSIPTFTRPPATLKPRRASRRRLNYEAGTKRVTVQNLRVDTLSQNVNSANAQGIGQVVIVTPDQIRQVDSDLAEKVKTFNWDTVMEETLQGLQSSAFADGPPKSDSTLGFRIIQNWEIIATSLNMRPKRPDAIGEGARVSLTLKQIERFRFLFEDEIQIVRAARNNVAHAVPIEEDALRAAVDISDRLVKVLKGPPTD